jgi:hypothetical protein
MANNIVTINVSQTQAPLPSTLQQTGALISQGGTSLVSGTYQLLTQLSDLTAITATSLSIVTATWTTNVATYTTSIPHGFTTGDTIKLTTLGFTPAGYNLVNTTATITGASAFTMPITSNPGSMTVAGSYTPADVAELTAMATTFFAQGSTTSVYVLELGAGSPADGVQTLNTFIMNNPATFYAYLMPRGWAGETTFVTFASNFAAPTKMTYFFVTMTTGNYGNWTVTPLKCVFSLVEAPTVAAAALTGTATEFSLAAAFYKWLNYLPSPINQVTPMAFSYQYGVTAYPPVGNQALFTSLKTYGVNYIDTGAEGGITNTILKWGTTMDVREATYWYSVDWVQINIHLALANEIINGSNNPINPLYYDQQGVDRLTARAQATMNEAITDGLALSPATVVAVPFYFYVTNNPSDYRTGTYNGLAVTYTPKRGFTSITFNINVTDFIVISAPQT